jgi:thioredoxin-like negative regulator of GroEL
VCNENTEGIGNFMEAVIQNALTKGVQMHVAGEFEIAGQLYESVIKLQPNHADANHNMGLLKVDVGNDLEALPYLQTAVEADTSVSQFWLSYITTLIKLDRVYEANIILNLAKDSGAQNAELLDLKEQLNKHSKTDAIINSNQYSPINSQSNILDTLNIDKALKIEKKKTKEGENENAKVI